MCYEHRMFRFGKIGWGGLASAVVGLGVPIAFADVPPLIGYGLIALGVILATVQFTLLFTQSPPQNGSGPSFSGGTHYHHYASLEQMLGSAVVQPGDTVQHHTATGTLTGAGAMVSGQMNVTEQGADTMAATGVTGLHGIYIGQIIVAAGSLASECSIDIAVRGYNGTGETIRLCEIAGHIRAGIGNKRDDINLPLPEMRGVASIGPRDEFIVVLRQSVPEDLVADFLQAWSNGENASLDLRELVIRTVSVNQPEKSARLPLWDGVNLRRVDDIVANRNTILSVGTSIASSNAFGVGVAVRNGDVV